MDFFCPKIPKYTFCVDSHEIIKKKFTVVSSSENLRTKLTSKMDSSYPKPDGLLSRQLLLQLGQYWFYCSEFPTLLQYTIHLLRRISIYCVVMFISILFQFRPTSCSWLQVDPLDMVPFEARHRTYRVDKFYSHLCWLGGGDDAEAFLGHAYMRQGVGSANPWSRPHGVGFGCGLGPLLGYVHRGADFVWSHLLTTLKGGRVLAVPRPLTWDWSRSFESNRAIHVKNDR